MRPFLLGGCEVASRSEFRRTVQPRGFEPEQVRAFPISNRTNARKEHGTAPALVPGHGLELQDMGGIEEVERAGTRRRSKSADAGIGAIASTGFLGSIAGAMLALGALGCVAANDMTGEAWPPRSEEIDDLDRARVAGAIDEADYLELRRGFILAD